MRSLLLYLACLTLIIAGCEGDVVLPSLSVRPAGGRIALPVGLALNIAAGALSAVTDIGIDTITDLAGDGVTALPDFTDGIPAISVSLRPRSTTFAQPVTVSMPFVGEPANLVMMRLADPSDDTWEAIGPIMCEDGVASVQLRSCSIYALVQAGTCPCFTGNQLRAFHAYGKARIAADG
ncbi:MAG: hypothetical protein ACI9MR_000232 [Myxococcota bacterium]|jgi:hypothetical protein